MVKQYKTVYWFLKALKRLANNTTMDLKGYDKLNKEQQLTLGEITASIDNLISEMGYEGEDKDLGGKD